MPTLKSDRQETWVLNRSGLNWILPEDTIVRVGSNASGIKDEGTGNTIQVFGNVLGDDAAIGVEAGDNALVEVGVDAWIVGFDTGIYGDDANVLVRNRGVIQAEWAIAVSSGKVVNSGSIISQDEMGAASAVFLDDWGEIENAGLIAGRVGIRTYDGGSVLNRATGVIVGQDTGVDLGDIDGAVNVIENHGILRGRDYAIESSGETRVINRGTIFGDIELSEYADRIDTRNGSVKGVIRGGEGDDTYLVSSQYIRIDETGASFGDVVRSSASFKLTGGLDHLYLLGDVAISGDGNTGDNRIFGNRASNNLYGLEGNDVLDGRGGNDLLVGGAGSDQFRFARGSGTDRIEDFTDLDVIVSNLVGTNRDFDRLDIRQRGNDVVIDFNNDDRLVLQDFRIEDLSVDDFSIA